MDNNESVTGIKELPPEIHMMILSELSLLELMNVSATVSYLRVPANITMKKHLNKYFPLWKNEERNKNVLGKEFINYFKIFQDEFVLYQNSLHDFFKRDNVVFSEDSKKAIKWAVMGEINKIKSFTLADEIKKFLYIVALSHGHRFDLTEEGILNLFGMALKLAAYYGRLEEVTNLLNQEDINITAPHKGGALCKAAGNGHIEVVRLLLEKESADIDADDKGGALWDAAKKGHIEVVRLLLEEESANITDEGKGLALWNAARNGHIEVVQLLLEEESANITDEDKGLALLHAIEKGHIEVVRLLLEKESADIIAPNKERALWDAAKKGHIEVVRLLLEKESANIDANYKGLALWNAIEKGHIEVVRLLLEKESANIDANYKGRALCDAAKKGHIEVVQLLLKKEGINIGAFHKGVALTNAAEKGHSSIVKTFFNYETQSIYFINKLVAFFSAKNKFAYIKIWAQTDLTPVVILSGIVTAGLAVAYGFSILDIMAMSIIAAKFFGTGESYVDLFLLKKYNTKEKYAACSPQIKKVIKAGVKGQKNYYDNLKSYRSSACLFHPLHYKYGQLIARQERDVEIISQKNSQKIKV